MSKVGGYAQAMDWHDCAVELGNDTCGEIESVVTEAARSALAQNRPIINGDIRDEAKNNAPAHSASDIEKMR